ncbi:MAG: 30S ribosomal protein S12 methylthiotransferase RimO [Deltaproteobacteria bacterium]|nr:MAG: 30S ribosomal protein S12 methylthiotransferase RimO [Deltaproteobacteria bacterium]
MARTIHFISLGCAKNRVDTEVMLGVGDDAGYELVASPEDAEVIVVNTCGFIGPAKEESVETILEMGQLKETGRCEQLVVAGCLSQRYPTELAQEMPEVDHFLGSSDMLKLSHVLKGGAPRMLVGNPADWTIRATDPRRLSQRSHSAFVKIAEGCNRTCSFCAIPAIRGKQRSRPVDDVVAEVRNLVANGLVEANLVSQDTIAYGRDIDGKPTLAELVNRVAAVDGLAWARLHYLYPENLTDELVDAVAGNDNVLPYIDMPLQHAATNMLRRMRRGHGGDRLYRVVEKLRERIPDMVFRTTFIVGHPGETDEDFDELFRFVEWAEFDHVGVFVYSHEEGTGSGEMEDTVAEEVKEQRHRRLMSLQRPISRAKLRRRVDTEVEVLVDGVSDESDFLLEGRFWGQAPEVDGKIYLTNADAQPGEIRRAIITEAADYDLVADLLGPDGTRDVPPGASRPRRRHLPTID